MGKGKPRKRIFKAWAVCNLDHNNQADIYCGGITGDKCDEQLFLIYRTRKIAKLVGELVKRVTITVED